MDWDIVMVEQQRYEWQRKWLERIGNREADILGEAARCTLPRWRYDFLPLRRLASLRVHDSRTNCLLALIVIIKRILFSIGTDFVPQVPVIARISYLSLSPKLQLVFTSTAFIAFLSIEYSFPAQLYS